MIVKVQFGLISNHQQCMVIVKALKGGCYLSIVRDVLCYILFHHFKHLTLGNSYLIASLPKVDVYFSLFTKLTSLNKFLCHKKMP